jgi:hypothetical protein
MMVNTMTALLAILAYGLALGIVGLLLAVRERSLRRKMRTAAEPLVPSVLAHTLHGRLRTDSGEELEVYFQSATR